ncbi:hypothetical protein B5V02_32230 [Mesorhizobium kowhaii]|uniref:Uncharacterized protein n=1 Tax=Mesorhizobium kowhaii TaxID=1300272 RepID=A0A2W7DT53_9HYPH|nr:hypothetical protein B5V02_32230 [Mesorhizobium kowhaii]
MILIFQHFFFNIKSLEPAECTYDPFRHVSISQCTRSAHEKMATYTKLSSGSWRIQVRRKGRYVSETFLRRDDARRCPLVNPSDQTGTELAFRPRFAYPAY